MSCLVCKSPFLYDVPISYEYTTDIFKAMFPNLSIKKCGVCGLFQADIDDTEETLKKLENYYYADYRNKVKVPSLEDKEHLLYKRGAFIAEFLSKHIPNKTISLKAFEKGCGFGFNLMHIKMKFPNATLYTDEPDEHTKPYLAKIGITMTRGGANSSKYDVIVMSHLIEHLTNPMETISIAYNNLKPAGLFYIEVPNSLHFVEPHLTFWTLQSFMKIYSKYLADKFTVEEFGTYGPIFYFADGVNGDWQRFLQTSILKNISWADLLNLETPNGAYLKILLKKKVKW